MDKHIQRHRRDQINPEHKLQITLSHLPQFEFNTIRGVVDVSSKEVHEDVSDEKEVESKLDDANDAEVVVELL